MKKLPKIYQNEITKKIRNNKQICYLKNEEIVDKISTIEEQEKNLDEVLNQIFNGLGHSYNIPVEITTKNKVYETGIVTKTKNKIVTLDNDVIPIENILNIEIKKKVQ